MLDKKIIMIIKKRGGGRREKRIRQKKNETAYPMENFKGPFLCSFVYFSCDFFLMPFLESERAREKSHRKHSHHEKHQELGKLSEGTRKVRILNKRQGIRNLPKVPLFVTFASRKNSSFWWSIPLC